VAGSLGEEPLRVGLVGTYPPTRCGIATFTAALAAAMADAPWGCRCGVVASVEERGRLLHSSEVVAHLVAGSHASQAAAVDALQEFEVVVVQHEFGIYGGDDGEEVVDLVRELAVPVILVLHTVLRQPTTRQRRIVEQLGMLADRVVVQSRAARTRLLEQYAVDTEKVRTIPHGAPPNLSAGSPRAAGAPPVVLSWGLLGPDKGIEWGIEAIAQLGDLEPAPRYVVIGQTHPKLPDRAGEDYRRLLEERARVLGVADRVEFDAGYHTTVSLLARVREADVVLLPYRSREQVVSGVLVEAIASGKPVVATRFPHAEELLGEGSGVLVPHEDAHAIALALRRLLTEETLASRAATVARRQARELFWESVGGRYADLAAELAGRSTRARPVQPSFPAPAFGHLLCLSDDVGVFEHAEGTAPRRDHGYCTDDAARALVVVMREPVRSSRLERLAETCLRFLEAAQLPDGRFRNRRSVGRRWLDEGDSDDAGGRALWAAGLAAAAASGGRQRERALGLFRRASGFRSAWPRANAFAILGGVEVVAIAPERPAAEALALIECAADGLGRVSPDPAWPWPEKRLTYANAVLAEARIAAAGALTDQPLLDEGLELLAWLVELETSGEHFSFTPVGGWMAGEPRPGFDQQPIEAAAMVDACVRAFDATGDREWADHALRAAAWFLGVNDAGVPLYDPLSGGCRDGLERDGTNRNEGAESTLALIGALQQTRRLQAALRSASSSSSFSTVAAPTQRSAAPYVR